MITNIELVKFVEKKIGIAYVYGMKGETMSLAKYNSLRSMYGNMVWASDRNKIGKVCVDCSGLISWATGRQRGSSQYKANAEKVHPISTISEAPVGVAVWKQGHIGVYIGNGEYIAADGSAYGVRKNKLSKADFTHWFEICDVQYVEDEKMEKRYNKVSELPVWAKATIQKLIDEKKIADPNNIDLSEDMLRVIVILKR